MLGAWGWIVCEKGCPGLTAESRASFPCYTARMRFIVPHLFPPDRLRDAAADGLRLPALETLRARGRMQAGAPRSLESVLGELFGLGMDDDAPLAPCLLKGAGVEPGDAWWLRVDPVHLQVRRDRLVPIMGAALEVQGMEAEALRASLAQHFGPAFSLLGTPEGDWYWRRSTPLGLDMPPPSVAAGRAVAVRRGGAALEWQKLVNEIQMLLHDHPINQARDAAGQPAINSLWAWGEGRWTAPRAGAAAVYADHPLARQLARGLGTACAAQPAHWDRSLPQSAVLVLDALLEPGQYDDAWAWRAALQGLERDWFVPLLRARKSFSLEDPQSGGTLHWRPAMAWRVWRRPVPLARRAAPPRCPAPAPAEDEFGNRC